MDGNGQPIDGRNRYVLTFSKGELPPVNFFWSLTTYFQHESPGKELEFNWLPAPAGSFYVILRTYGPKPEMLDGSYRVPPVQLDRRR